MNKTEIDLRIYFDSIGLNQNQYKQKRKLFIFIIFPFSFYLYRKPMFLINYKKKNFKVENGKKIYIFNLFREILLFIPMLYAETGN